MAELPLPIDTLLASMFEVLKQRGSAREIAILHAAKPSAYVHDHDNWNGGTDSWTLSLSVDLSLFSQLSEAARTEAQKVLLEVGSQFFVAFENDNLDRVGIFPSPVANPNWRGEAAKFLTGEGTSNQGRVRSDNPAWKVCDGLLFRSQPEINLYQALKSAKQVFAPLPVFVLETGRRIEPDFVLLRGGEVFVVEVDGSTYHRETPAEAQERVRSLENRGVLVERVKADECDTVERATKRAAKLLQDIDTRAAAHRR